MLKKRSFFFLMISLIVALTFGISACAPKPPAETAATTEAATTEAAAETKAAGEEVTLGIIFPHPESPFVQNTLKATQILADKYGWEVVLRTPSTSEEIEQLNTMVEDMAMSGVKAMMIQSMDIGSVAAYAKRAMDNGVYVIHMNWDQASPIEGAFVTVIGVSQFGNAEAVGKVLGKMAPQGAKAVYVAGTPGYHTENRGKGFQSGMLQTNPDYEFLGEVNTVWTRETGYSAMQDMLQRFPEIDVVYGASDEIALGAIEAIKEAGRLDKILVGGFDANPNAIESIKAGELTATVSIAPLEMSQESVRIIKALLDGEKIDVPPLIVIPSEVVTAENADAFLQKYVDFGIK